MGLVQISSAQKATSTAPGGAVRHLFSITLVDKFFLIGAVAGLFGSIGLGAYLWLLRSGLVPLDLYYHPMRHTHAVLQFYLFFTPFILGFLLQSAPKLLETREPLPTFTRLAFPGTVVAAFALLVAPSSIVGPAIVALCAWGLALALVPAIQRADWAARLRFGFFTVLGLAALGSGPFFNLTSPHAAILLFWFGIVPIIFATGQQFLSGLLSGTRPTAPASLRTLTTFLISGFLLSSDIAGKEVLASILVTLTFLSFLHSTKAWNALKHLPSPIAFAFATAHLWALAGGVLLAFGPEYADSVVHIWGIGYAVTLILAISLRIIAWVTDVTLISDWLVTLLLLLWQVVAILRGFQAVIRYPNGLVWIGTGCAAAVMCVWALTIAISVLSMLVSRLRSARQRRRNLNQYSTNTTGASYD